MISTSEATTGNSFISIQDFKRSVGESIIEVPAFKELQSYTVTVSANDDPLVASPWKISGVDTISLDFGSRQEGTGTIYGLKFILVAPPEVTTAIFQTPAITFATADTPAFNIAPYGTNEATIIWANTVPVDTAQSFQYTLHAIIDGHEVSHDPTVENLPPSTP